MSFRRLGLLLALPTMVGLSLAACGTEDDAAPGPSGGSGATAGEGGTGGSAGKGGTGAEAGSGDEGGMAGSEPGPGPAGAGGLGGDGAGGESGQAGDGAGSAGESNGGKGGGGGTAGKGGSGGSGGSSGSSGTAGKGGNGGSGGSSGSGGGAGACHTDVQNFNTNPGGGMGVYLASQTGPVAASTVTYSSTEGSTAAGSGQLNATFGAYGETAQLGLFMPTNTSWTCQSKLHAMVKLVSATDLSHIASINFSVSSNAYAVYTAQTISTASFVLNTWTPIVLNLATATPAPVFTDISGIGIQLKTVTTGTLPVPTTMYVDDVWVE